jgi:hypothetical protein
LSESDQFCLNLGWLDSCEGGQNLAKMVGIWHKTTVLACRNPAQIGKNLAQYHRILASLVEIRFTKHFWLNENHFQVDYYFRPTKYRKMSKTFYAKTNKA